MDTEQTSAAQQKHRPEIQAADQRTRPGQNPGGKIDYWELLAELRIG